MSNVRAPHLIFGVAIFLGVCADIFFYGQAIGMALPIFIVLSLASIYLISRVEGHTPSINAWLGPVALTFALWLAVRTEPMLVFLNAVALFSLLILLIASVRSDAFHRLPVFRLIEQIFTAIGTILFKPIYLFYYETRQIPLNQQTRSTLTPVLRGVLIAIPILIIFGILLASADMIFASYALQLFTLRLPFNVWTGVSHTLFVSFASYMIAGGLIAVLNDGIRTPSALPSEGETDRLTQNGLRWRFLGSTEALTVLILTDLLFGLFMLIQGAYLFGGLDSLARTGLTYAEYARRGFFELLTVACLALMLLCLLAIITHRETARIRWFFNSANALMVLLVLGILASAFQRMWLYELAYGFTRLRLYTHTFMIWLAFVLILFLVALMAARPKLFITGSLASTLIYLTILNIISPDALIARENIARYRADPAAITTSPASWLESRQNAEVDLTYLMGLSTDAVPELVQVLPLLDASQHRMVSEHLLMLKNGISTENQNWQSWHLSRFNADQAITKVISP